MQLQQLRLRLFTVGAASYVTRFCGCRIQENVDLDILEE